MRRLLSLVLLGAAAAGSLALGPADDGPWLPDVPPVVVPEPPFNPFPLGVCARVPLADQRRYCAIVPDPR